MPGVEIVEQNIQIDHIHSIMIIPPRYAVSTVIGKIKGQTSSLMLKKFRFLKQAYCCDDIIWSPGYFVSTVGLDETMILKYVKYQYHQDSGQAKLAF